MLHEQSPDSQESHFSTVLIGDVAQEMGNYPWHAMNHAQWLHDRSLAWYQKTGLAGRDEGRANYLAARAVWNALTTPLVYGAEQTLLAEVLPRIQRGRRLAASAIAASNVFDARLSHPYEGEDLTLLRIMCAYSSDAMERFTGELIHNPSQWYAPVWQAYTEWHPRFCAASRELKPRPGERPPLQRTEDPWMAIMEVAVDGNETAWSVMKRALKHFPTWGEAWEQNPKGGLLAIMDELERPASVKAALVTRYLNRYKEAPREKCPFTHTSLPFGEGGIWRLPRLKDGTQHPPGFCPAISLERGHYHEWRARTEALYDQVYQDTGRSRRARLPYGTATSVGLRNRMMGYAALEIRNS